MDNKQYNALFSFIWNIANDVLVHAFEKANGVKVPYQIVDRRPGDLPTCYADPAKSAEILGWKAEKNLVDMCRDSWNWQSKNPMGYGE